MIYVKNDVPFVEARPLDRRAVRPRRASFSFPDTLPKHWLQGSMVKTHFFNSLNLLLPAAEDFLVRVMRAELSHIANPELRAQIRGFMGQEAVHSRAHTGYNAVLRKQGYAIDPYLRLVDALFREGVEKGLGRRMSVSTIAGIEHLTALLAEIMLKHAVVEEAPSPMRELWEWHAAEELEHKTLGYDYLREVDADYGLRVAGALVGAAILTTCAAAGMLLLAAQDEDPLPRGTLRDLNDLFFFGKYRLLPRGLRTFVTYFNRGFHPSHHCTDQYAERVLSR